MNSTNSQSPVLPYGEQPLIPDTDDAYDAYINGLYDEIEAELARTPKPTFAQKLGLPGLKNSKNPPEAAIISGDSSKENASSMLEVTPPYQASREAYGLALNAAPVGRLEDLVLDEYRVNEKEGTSRVGGALAASAEALSGANAPEAQIVRGGYVELNKGNDMQARLNVVRSHGQELVAARQAAARRELA